MAEAPDHLDLARHRDASPRLELAARRTLFVLLVAVAVAVAALLGLFGQRPSTASVAAERAELSLSVPSRLRGGVFFQGRFTVEAHAQVGNAVLVLAPGWLENMHVNTIEPAPTEEASRDGRLALSFGPLDAGDRLVVYMQFQVNPANVGRRSADVELYDGDAPLARVGHTITVFP